MSLTRKASPEKNDVDDPRRRKLEAGEHQLLYSAIGGGRTLDVYNMLLRNNIHPDAEVTGINPLSFACANGNFDLAEFLIMNGASLEGEGDPALFSALGYSEGKEECAKLLVRHKADVNGRDSCGFTPLMTTCFFSRTTLRLLLENQADVNLIKNGETALDFAKKNAADSEVLGWHEAAAKRSSRK